MKKEMNRLEELTKLSGQRDLDDYELRELLRLQKSDAAIRAAVKSLADELNSMGNSDQAFAQDVVFDELNRQHRTLQQNFWRSIAGVISKLASVSPSYFDGRNEASVKWAKEVAKIQTYFPFV